ncbi:MAG: ThuA domain-containing protein [Verrucomicrobiae bacterium]|nr:ThuA domain-containing protein [Verrucomicrobiae bacterium]
MKRLITVFLLMAGLLITPDLFGATKKLIIIAGKPSHPPGMHEFRAGALLLQKCLQNVPGLTTLVYSNGWPQEANAFDGADGIVIYSDGGGGHPAIQGDRLKVLQEFARKGVGIGMMHYACETPANKGGNEFLEWIGGFYEDKVSCNPMWSPEFKEFPEHPITRGLKPFSILDEWYFNIHFRDKMEGITGILVATPSDEVRKGPYVWPKGPYPHIIAASGRPEIMLWVVERPDGGRGFGFTGGHYHKNWGDPNFRKVILNTLVWLVKMDVPANGIESTVAPEELEKNLDPKK